MQLQYGKGHLTLKPCGMRVQQVLQPAAVETVDPEQTVRQLLKHPSDGSLPLAARVRPSDRVIVVVSDITRSWIPTAALLRVIISELEQCQIPDRQITVLVAVGSHRLLTESELEQLTGPEIYRRVKVLNHKCHEPDELVYLGKTKRGTPIHLNRRYVESECRILTGGITYHFMTGFSGGRKSIVPGIAGYETIQANHRMLLASENQGTFGSGQTAGNPLHEDMMEIAARIPPTFLVNVIPGPAGTIGAVVGGNWDTAWEIGTQMVSRYFGVTIPQPADLVICSSGGFPLDINLYQAVKALINGATAVTSQGGLILVAECAEGTGAVEFADWLEHPTPRDMAKALMQRFTVPGFIAYTMRLITERHPTALVSSLPREIALKTGMKPFNGIDEAVDWLKAQVGTHPTVHLLPQGNITLPIMGKASAV